MATTLKYSRREAHEVTFGGVKIGSFSTANLRNKVASTEFFRRFYFRDAT